MNRKPWMDTRKSSEERAELLLSEMTTEEKCGQLCQRLHGFDIYEIQGENPVFSPDFYQELEQCHGLGMLYGLFRADPWSGRNYENGLSGKTAIHVYNLVQNACMEKSRLKIPVLTATECPHGHQALNGYLLPVNLAVGASFDPDQYRKSTKVCGTELRAMGAHMALCSMLDMLRDPRWGRSEECYGEDPYLSSRMAEAAVKGFHDAGCQVVAKHFAAQGAGCGGINAGAAGIGERELREIHLPAARAAVQAGCDGVMAAYNEIDGIFCHANHHLLTDILRGEMGFDGIVMSDGCAIDQLNVMTGDFLKSAALAINSGVDVGLWDHAFSLLPQAVADGLVPEKRIDQAVRRLLVRKFEAGLFEHPFLPEEGESPEGNTMYLKHPESLQLARESVVLLENREHALPLIPVREDSQITETMKIACMGPLADDIYRQMGDYTPPMEEGCGFTVLQGLREVFGPEAVSYTVGCGLRSRDEKCLWEAEAMAGESDVTILVLGGSSSRFEGVSCRENGAAEPRGDITMDCGEGIDLSDLRLPEEQLELFARIRKKAGKLITIVIAGRPMILKEIREESDALLLAFYPGPCGGLAIGEILAGLVNPSGRLPVSLPAHEGQLPVYYNYKKSYQAWKYRDGNTAPLYTFGYGLDYASYSYRNFRIIPEEAEDPGKKGVMIRGNICNDSAINGCAVLLLYVEDVHGSVVTRVKMLKAFSRIPLRAGEEKEIFLYLPAESFEIVNAEYKTVTEAGQFRLYLEDKGKQIAYLSVTLK